MIDFDLADLYKIGEVDTSAFGCWVWRGVRTAQGYGWLAPSVARQIGERRAHRAALVLSGIALPQGINGLHGCDNPPCVRVGEGHVRAGTQGDNVREAAARGRLNGAYQWSREQRLAAGLDGSVARAARWAGHEPRMVTRDCAICGEPFTRKHRPSREVLTCSPRCRGLLAARSF